MFTRVVDMLLPAWALLRKPLGGYMSALDVAIQAEQEDTDKKKWNEHAAAVAAAVAVAAHAAAHAAAAAARAHGRGWWRLLPCCRC